MNNNDDFLEDDFLEKEFDFSKAKKNPYAAILNANRIITLDDDVTNLNSTT